MYKLLIPFLLAGSLAIAAAVNYSYDAAGRLAKVDYGAAGSITYTYDNSGNVLSRTVESGSAGASVIASAKLVTSNDGETRIEIRGANLAAEGTSVTIDGDPAKVLSRCNATVSRTCKTDLLSVLAPDLKAAGNMRIVVLNGAKSSPPFSLFIHGRETSKPVIP